MSKTKNPDALTQEPVASVWMYKDTFGDWKPFLNDQHRIDTIASGEWECTQFFATPQPAASVASGEPPKEATAAMYLQLTDALEYSSGKDGMEWSPEEWAAHLLAHYKAIAQLQPRTLHAPVSEQAMREQFEAWFTSQVNKRPGALCRNMPDHSYNDLVVHTSWLAWQACAALHLTGEQA